MKTLLLSLVALAAACRKPQPPAPQPPVPEAAPAMEPNAAARYVEGLRDDVKRAEAARSKADGANQKAQEAEKIPE